MLPKTFLASTEWFKNKQALDSAVSRLYLSEILLTQIGRSKKSLLAIIVVSQSVFRFPQ